MSGGASDPPKPKFTPRVSSSSRSSSNSLDARLPGALPNLLSRANAATSSTSTDPMIVRERASTTRTKKERKPAAAVVESSRVAFSAGGAIHSKRQTTASASVGIPRSKSSSSSSSTSASDSARMGVKRESVMEVDHLDVDEDQYQPVEFIAQDKEKIKEEEVNDDDTGVHPGGFLRESVGEFMFIQFPKQIPGLFSADEHVSEEVNADGEEGEREINEAEDFEEDGDDQGNQKKTVQSMNALHSLSGEIGKLRIFESGRTVLVIGENEYDIDFGVPYPFVQEIASIQIDSSASNDQPTGTFSRLGNVDHRLVCSINPY